MMGESFAQLEKLMARGGLAGENWVELLKIGWMLGILWARENPVSGNA